MNILRIHSFYFAALSTGADNFVRCPPDAMKWHRRKYLLIEEILHINADVICLQEVDHFAFFKQILFHVGYTGHFFPKPWSPCLNAPDSNGPDGCALFYRSSRLELVRKQTLNLLERDDKETNQVCLMGEFKDKVTDREFVVVTTHFKAKPEYHQVRFHEGVFMEKNVESFRSGKPVLICGDFNAEPTEDVVKYYQASALELQSAYTQLSESGCENPAYTTWKIRGSKTPGGKEKEACHTIDYMWYQPKHMGVTSLLSIPSGDEIGPNRLPSWHYPSDHFSLAADFIFNQG